MNEERSAIESTDYAAHAPIRSQTWQFVERLIRPDDRKGTAASADKPSEPGRA
jgi:hypothetical protein